MHGSIKMIAMQTAEIKALSLNQMQVLTQLFSGESDVPRFFLLFKKEHAKTFFGALNKAAHTVITLGGSEYVLVIVCECCMRPVPCGPQNKGYVINMPSELLVKMAPALLLGLKFFVVAASVASGASGVKLPLPCFASLDALKSSLASVQALVGASLVNDLTECAESAFLEEAAGRAVALSDDRSRSLAAASGRIQRATGDSYKSFKALLEKHDPNAEDYGEASCILSAPNRALVLSPSFKLTCAL